MDFSFAEEEYTLDDVLGREQEKKELHAAMPSADLDEILIISNFSAILFCGGHGCGKSYLIRCFAGTLMQNGFCLYETDCAEILRKEDAGRVWSHIFEEILVRTNPEGEFRERIFLKLTHLDAVSENSEAAGLLADYLERLSEEDCMCIIAAECDLCEDISIKLLDQMMIMDLELPCHEDRRAYFERYFTVEIDNPENANEILTFTPLNFSMDTFAHFCAEKTDLLNYFDMERVIQQCKRIWKAKLADIVLQEDEIYAQLMNPKGIRVDEDEFLDVVKRVKKFSKNRETIASAARNRSSVQNNVSAAPTIIQVPAVQAAPQIVYAQAPDSVRNSRVIPAVYDTAPNSLTAVLDRIDEDPMISDLLHAYNMLPRNQTEQYQKEEDHTL